MMARTAYSASKAGMNAFARALALEVDRDGIAVHIVTPGPVETEMLQDVPFEMHAIQVADVADAVAWLDRSCPPRLADGQRSDDDAYRLVHLLDADHVAGGIPQRAVAYSVRLIGRLLDDLGSPIF
jgi:NAD(P)-dependent dehydrogenase (short-subunit alcohol dehydrogenase family)